MGKGEGSVQMRGKRRRAEMPGFAISTHLEMAAAKSNEDDATMVDIVHR